MQPPELRPPTLPQPTGSCSPPPHRPPPFTADANDFLYRQESSRDYHPAPGLGRVQAALLAVNSADDERYPPELGIMERELKRIPGARLYLIPASEDTCGHGTTGMAKFWNEQLRELLAAAPRR